MKLSPNFTLEELTRSDIAARLGIDNTPGPDALANLGWWPSGWKRCAASWADAC